MCHSMRFWIYNLTGSIFRQRRGWPLQHRAREMIVVILVPLLVPLGTRIWCFLARRDATWKSF